jgi:hypothetical protein
VTVLYQQVPMTFDPYTVIPDGAPPSSGLTEEGAAEVVAASETFASETAIAIDVSSSGPFVVDVILTPVTPPVEPFRATWDFGDGRVEAGADDTDQHHTYERSGDYLISAIVSQPGASSFTLYTRAAFDDDGALVYPVSES